MASIRYVPEPEAGKAICAMSGSVDLVHSKARDIYGRANAINPKRKVRVPVGHGGSYETELRNPNYGLVTDMAGGMPRGRVYTANFYSNQVEREYNVLLKSMH